MTETYRIFGTDEGEIENVLNLFNQAKELSKQYYQDKSFDNRFDDKVAFFATKMLDMISDKCFYESKRFICEKVETLICLNDRHQDILSRASDDRVRYGYDFVHHVLVPKEKYREAYWEVLLELIPRCREADDKDSLLSCYTELASIYVREAHQRNECPDDCLERLKRALFWYKKAVYLKGSMNLDTELLKRCVVEVEASIEETRNQQ